MRKLIIIMLVVSCASCSTSITTGLGFEYTGYIEERGLGITMKPPLWDTLVEWWKS